MFADFETSQIVSHNMYICIMCLLAYVHEDFKHSWDLDRRVVIAYTLTFIFIVGGSSDFFYSCMDAIDQKILMSSFFYSSNIDFVILPFKSNEGSLFFPISGSGTIPGCTTLQQQPAPHPCAEFTKSQSLFFIQQHIF